MSRPDKWIIFLGHTFSGHNHDYKMLKEEFPPALDWFADINVLVDLGRLNRTSTVDRFLDSGCQTPLSFAL
jgi:hypothetical protein